MLRKRISVIVIITMVLSLFMQANVFAVAPKTKSIAEPTGLTVINVTDKSVELKWNTVSGATGYRVYRLTPNDASYIQIASITSTSYKDSSLNPNTSYWYYIVAYNKFAISTSSAHMNIVTKEFIQATPEPTPEPTPVPTPEPTPVPTPTPTPIPEVTKEVFGFTTYYYAGDKSSYNSIVNNKSSLDSIVTHTYQTDGSGNLTGDVPSEQISYANDNGITALAMVANNFSGSTAKALLESEVNRKNFITNIQLQLQKYNYKGVCIDLEGVYASNRSHYTALMSELYTALNPLGYMVTAAVPAKASDNIANTWNAAYDYIEISKYVDKLMLMAYDEHYPGGTAGAVASIGWVEKVADYAVSVVPKEKIILGVAAYGYDWSTNGTKAYSISGINNLATANNAEIKWDDASQTPYFDYIDSAGVSHSVWFENSYSVASKLNLVNSRDLAGIAIWRLGLENADYWNTINIKLGK